jgi:hypothetical protein
MVRSRWKVFPVAVALVCLALVPSVAGAFARAFELPGLPGSPAYFNGIYLCPAANPPNPPVGNFPAPPGWGIFYPVGAPNLPKLVPAGGPVGVVVLGTAANGVRFWGSHPAVGSVFAVAWAWGAAAAGKNTAASPDTIQDSLQVSVNRSVPGQVTISISGVARHLNPAADPQPITSSLRVSVYPDSESAKEESGHLARGEMRFTGSASTTFSGFFTAGDFTGPSVTGDGNDFQVATNGTIVKVVAVPNAALACVDARVDPNANAPVPASSPPTLALLAVALLGGGVWFMSRRRRPELA